MQCMLEVILICLEWVQECRVHRHQATVITRWTDSIITNQLLVRENINMQRTRLCLCVCM